MMIPAKTTIKENFEVYQTMSGEKDGAFIELFGEGTSSRTWLRIRSPYMNFAYPANTRDEAEGLFKKLMEEHDYRPLSRIDE